MLHGLEKDINREVMMQRSITRGVTAMGLIIPILSSCGAGSPPPRFTPAPAPFVPVPQYGAAGLDRVLGRDANALVAVLGKPDADVHEGSARKLQFSGPICVLDAYLYPKGNSAPVVTHVDARQRDGSPIDRASCVAALTRRGGGR